MTSQCSTLINILLGSTSAAYLGEMGWGELSGIGVTFPCGSRGPKAFASFPEEFLQNRQKARREVPPDLNADQFTVKKRETSSPGVRPVEVRSRNSRQLRKRPKARIPIQASRRKKENTL